MSAAVLDQLSLGYRLLWNAERRLAGIELHVDAAAAVHGVDARHLQSALAELWPEQAPPLLLSLRHPGLLLDLLVHAQPGGFAILLPAEAATDPLLQTRAQQAEARGLRLLWPATARSGVWTQRPPGGTPRELLLAPDQRSQARSALASGLTWAVAGWPVDDVLQQLPAAAQQADRRQIAQLLRAIEADSSLDRLEALLCADPVLSLRFLQQVNQLATRERGEIHTLARGLQLWGLRAVQQWLQTQLAQATDEADLRPVRGAMVLHAQLLVQLLDPGDEEELRHEVYLCGLLAAMDRLLGTQLPTLLASLPLSPRVTSSLFEREGPYVPALQLAQALAYTDMRSTQRLCASYGYAAGDVNRALLRTLSAATT